MCSPSDLKRSTVPLDSAAPARTGGRHGRSGRKAVVFAGGLLLFFGGSASLPILVFGGGVAGGTFDAAIGFVVGFAVALAGTFLLLWWSQL